MPNGRIRMLLVAVLTMIVATSSVRGVQTTPPQSSSPLPDVATRPGRDDRDKDPNIERMQEQAAKNRNTDRQKRLVADTEKLLSLATELKQDVDKTDKNTLSVDVIKKADEIEKLAHSVKERMKG